MNVAGAGAEYAELRQAGSAIAQTATAYADVTAQKAAIQAKAEEAQARATYELELTQFAEDLKVTERDPDRYLATFKQKAGEIRQRYEQGMSPGARAIFSTHAPFVERTGLATAKKHSTGLYKEQQSGRLVTTLDAIKQRAGRLDVLDDAGHAQALTDATRAIETLRPLHGDKATSEALIAARKELATERARRDKDGPDPEGFLERLHTTHKGMDPEKRDLFAESARGKVLTLKREEDQRFKDLQKREDVDAETERQRLLIHREDLASKGTYTDAMLQQDIEQRVFAKPEEVARVRALMTKEQRTSKPDIYQQLSVAARQFRPAADLEARIDRAYLVEKSLNDADYKDLKDRVIARRDHFESMAKSDVGRQQTQAEQRLRTALGFSSPYDAGDKQQNQLLDIGLRELTARSAAFPEYGGKEQPLPVVDDIINRLQPIRQERILLDISTQRRSLRYPAETSQEAAAFLEAAKARGEFGDPQKPNTAYHDEMRKVLDLKRAETTLAVRNARTKETSSATPRVLRKDTTPTEHGESSQ